MSEISMERKRDLLRICNHRLRDGVDAVCLKASELQILLNDAERLAAIEPQVRELADEMEATAVCEEDAGWKRWGPRLSAILDFWQYR